MSKTNQYPILFLIFITSNPSVNEQINRMNDLKGRIVQEEEEIYEELNPNSQTIFMVEVT